jgi:hypothetical protein
VVKLAVAIREMISNDSASPGFDSRPMHETARPCKTRPSFCSVYVHKAQLYRYGDIAHCMRSLVGAVKVRIAIDFQLLLIKVFIRACSNTSR